MGIPKFFRWMSERYPDLCEVAKEDQIPENDNFYLDMNGIIHNCSHPCDGDVHFRLSEADMFEDIFHYVETLFKIIRPKKYFFLAVDGVAPRAKMNQQRGRRFRTAKEASDREEAALKKGDILPTEQRFDSNCITPGTQFMIRLNKEMKKFIKHKLNTDEQWQNIKVILSGHESPGEGEHKIMDFIRFQRSQPNYDPETRHCLYGLDTDLIMLGLSSHETNFILLREENRFNKNDSNKGKSQRADASKTTFNILNLMLLRRYIEKDFIHLKSKLPFKFDLEAIIDDWILICFLVGNDFIPHIPHFHIHKKALPKILDVYQSTLTKLDGYLNEKGFLNLRNFRKFSRALARLDFENYQTLLKESGGECSKDDFAKLNTFVRQKLRITGISRDKTRRPVKKVQNPFYHSQNHKPNIWYDIQKPNWQKRESHQTKVDIRDEKNENNHKNAPQQFDNVWKVANPKPATQHKQSSKPHGQTNSKGVHNYTEEQINNSITLCADGDFVNISEEEFLSDEKFPGEQSRKFNNRSRDARNKKFYPPRHEKERLGSEADFDSYKQTYYKEKFKIEPTKENIYQIVREYVRALQWNLHYYYHGCISWGWFYPYHYAPLISDVVNFEEVDLKFERGEPFKPFEQLLSVLPAASSSLLPKVYRSLVQSQDSPLAHYFPAEVEFDLNGKQNDWEAVVLAPFIDEDILLNASHVYNLFLAESERKNNVHGPHLLFEYTNSNRREAEKGHVKITPIPYEGFQLPIDKIKWGLLKKEKDKGSKNYARNLTLVNHKFKDAKHKPYPKSNGNFVRILSTSTRE